MSKDEDKPEETPEPKKDNKFVGFVKRHKKGIIIGSALTATGVVLTVMTRNGKLAHQMSEFIAEEGLTDKYLGLDESRVDTEE